ncbi:MAG: hypothetical protein ACTHOE_10955, partial [Conexibacter sp.]
VSAVARRACAAGATTHAVAGQARISADALARLGLADVQAASTRAELRAAGERLARAASAQAPT